MRDIVVATSEHGVEFPKYQIRLCAQPLKPAHAPEGGKTNDPPT